MTATTVWCRVHGTRLGEVLGFGAVGVLGFVVQIGSFNLLVHFGVGPLTSNAVAVLVSTATNYVGNRYLSFAHRRAARPVREAVVFLLVNAVAFALAEAVLASAYLVNGEHDRLLVNLLNLAGIGLGTIVRFWAYRRLVFVSPAADASPPALATVEV